MTGGEAKGTQPRQDGPWPGLWGGEKIVISGMSGRLPKSDNLAEFREHLINGEDMLSETEGRWPTGYFGLAPRMGKLNDITKFDASFFGVHPKQADHMDAQIRLQLEAAYEAIVDAGYNPQELRGRNIGVFVGTGMSETHDAWSHDLENMEGYVTTGCNRSMFSARLSFFFDFKGPAISMDTACSSALIAMNQAYQAIRTGNCEAAIIGGTNLVLRPGSSAQFGKLGMMSDACRAFNETVEGYCRSEGNMTIFMQKESAARRIYAEIVHTKTNSDGFKDQGITYPSGEIQGRLIKEIYSECGVEPSTVAYVEAHGTGTAAGDPQELNAIADIFCKGRKDPLPVGSVKSNVGHTEFLSGLTSIAKVVIAMEDGFIPGNLHFDKPNPAISCLTDGRVKVVTERTPWSGGYVGVNCFGFGGANVHILLKSRPKSPASKHPAASLPRLATYAARTEDGVEHVLENYVKHQDNVYFQRLLQENANVPGTTHPYRGYVTLNGENRVQEIAKCPLEKRPVWYIFAGMGCQWTGMGRDMMNIPAFRDSITRSDAVLRPHGVSVLDLIQKSTDKTFDELINSLVGILSIQVALVDVLKSIGVEPAGFIGHSAGEMACAYADGGLTAEETILAAYWRGQCMKEALKTPGAMAAVGLTWEEAHQRCPPGVVPACHNAIGTVTISGPAGKVASFVETLKKEGVFAKAVQSNGGAFHSYMMKPSEKIMLDAMRKVIKKPKQRTKRWISTSIPEDKWDSDLAKYSSAEYHVNNVISTVLFQEALTHVPDNAIAIEIAPHGLLQALLKRSFTPGTTTLSLMKRQHPNNAEFMFSNLGKMYINGGDFNPLGMYQPVKLPVPSGTPMISPLVKWDHSQTWKIPVLSEFGPSGGSSGASCSFDIDASPQSPDHYLTGHKIDGRILFPATGYLVLVWKALAKMKGEQFETMPVAIEDVHIHRATILPTESNFKFDVSIAPGTGKFELIDNGAVVVSGMIYSPSEPVLQMPKFVVAMEDTAIKLTGEDIYNELRLRGYEYGPTFQSIVECRNSGEEGSIMWKDNNWIPFMDAMLQISVASKPGKNLILPTRIRSIRIDPRGHTRDLFTSDNGTRALKVTVDTELGSTVSGGIEIVGLHTSVAPRRQKAQAPPNLEEQCFVPYFEPNLFNDDPELKEYSTLCNEYTRNGMHNLDDIEIQKLPNRDLFRRRFRKDCKESLMHKEKLSHTLRKSKFTLVKVLKDVFEMERNDAFKQNAASAMRHQHPDVLNDRLLGALNDERALKTCVDIVLENTAGNGLKIVEIDGTAGMLYRHIIPQMSTQPEMKMDYYTTETESSLFDEKDIEQFEMKNVVWKQTDDVPNQINKTDLLVLARSLHRKPNIQEFLLKVKGCLKENGFVLVQETTNNLDIPLAMKGQVQDFGGLSDQAKRTVGPFCDSKQWTSHFTEAGLEVVAMKSDGLMNSLFLCRKCAKDRNVGEHKLVDVSDLSFNWVESVKEALAEDDQKTVWLTSDSEPLSGILGMVNSIRQEEGGYRVRCMFNASTDDGGLPKIDSAEFGTIIENDLAVNVYKDGQWGSYRYLPLKTDRQTVSTEHAYVNVLTRGDLASLRWIESPLKYFDPAANPNKELCSVYYTSLNFRDIMLATGKLPPDAIPGDLASQDCILGMEFSGRDQSGKRIMGLLPAKGLASSVDVHKDFMWEVPDSWTLEEAASVPVVYTTVYYALIVRGEIKRGDRVLIHAGSGGVGQAAIAVALHHGCEVFTTVGTAEKREYLKKRFPQLKDMNFANSRDESFEWDIIRATSGKGVDVILNSLAEEKLQASLRILAQHGRFLEIGKVDLSSNNPLGMGIFLKNITFHGILLDALFDEGNQDWLVVADLLRKGIKEGAVKPLKTTTFDKDDVEDAFRYMAQGKHIGKVLIKVRDEEPQKLRKSSSFNIAAIPRVACDPNKSYIITGGLGGFGLELTHWLIQRGAKNLVLTSRSGIKNGYQSRCVRLWQELGINLIVSTSDVSQSYGAERVFEEARSMAPVGGVFHLAMVLKDCLMRNQTKERFQSVGGPKVVGTIHLDQITRRTCSDSLDWFVVFSSLASGRGNAGQSNYAFANSFMERVCEVRKRDGLPGLAIQWGAIGDVGAVTRMIGTEEVVVKGMLPQKIGSCLDALETFLHQPQPVVASTVLAEKVKAKVDENKSSGLVHVVANILGVKDVATVNQDMTLGDLGLDSLMGVEVKQALERISNLDLPMKEVRLLNFKKLIQIEAGGT